MHSSLPRIFTSAVTTFTALFFIPALFSQSAVFTDGFGNSNTANADRNIAYWSVNAVTDTTISESGGALILNAGLGGVTTNVNPWINGPVSSDFNFFRRKLRYAATVSIDGTAPSNLCSATFSFVSMANKSFTSPDNILLRLRGDNMVFLGTKQGLLYASSVALPGLNSVTMPGKISGFELTMDAVNFTLKIYHAGGTGSTTLSGPHGLVEALWGENGDSAITIEAGRSSGSTLSSVVTVDQVSVSTVDASTALFEDSFNNGSLANSDEETGVWTTTISQTSTAVETDGKLTLIARQAAAGAIIASQNTPVASRFNFFNQRLRISADVLASGTVDNIYKRPSRMSLASTTGDGKSSPDVLYVGMRESGGLLLGTKIDSANTDPDTTPGTKIKRLIGNNDGVIDFDYVALGGGTLDHLELTLDSSRFLLTSHNSGRASGRARFSGAHGLNRSDWGAGGDSALMLESVRNGSAGADTTAGTAWDNLRVEPSSRKILAEPYWDYRTTYATSTGSNPTTKTESYRVWVPTTDPVIRGVIFIAPGSGDDFRYMVHDPVMQETARDLGFALVAYRNNGNMNLWSKNSALIRPAVQAVLDGAATASGHPEISNAPLLITGFSAGSRDASFLAAYWTERVIGWVAHRGGGRITDTSLFYSIPISAFTTQLKNTPGLFVAGGADTTNDCATVKVNFDSWRSRDAQVAYAVDWRITHTLGREPPGTIGNQSWESTMTWITEVARLRYPRPMLPPTGSNPTTWNLITLANNSGWLATNPTFSSGNTPSLTSTFTTIAAYASYGGTVSAASWLPNETTARMYRALVSTDLVGTRTAAPLQSPLRIVSPVQFADTVTTGQTVKITVDPREFDDTYAVTQMSFYDGPTLLGTDTTGPDWSHPITPTTTGTHTLNVVATRSDGAQSSVFSLLQVTPADFAPVIASTQSSSIAANATVTGSVAATDPEGDTSTYLVASNPQKGLVTVNASTGAYTYRPAYRYAGTDSFVLRVSAGSTFTDVTVSVTVAAPIDGNSNGLPDSWESTNSVTDPAGDPDGDGQTNLQEYLADTNPRDAASVFATTAFTRASTPPDNFTLTWAAVGGVRYRVQYTENLASGFTDIVRPASQEIQPGTVGVSGSAAFTDDFTLTPASGPRRFYRVRIVTGAE